MARGNNPTMASRLLALCESFEMASGNGLDEEEGCGPYMDEEGGYEDEEMYDDEEPMGDEGGDMQDVGLGDMGDDEEGGYPDDDGMMDDGEGEFEDEEEGRYGDGMDQEEMAPPSIPMQHRRRPMHQSRFEVPPQRKPMMSRLRPRQMESTAPSQKFMGESLAARIMGSGIRSILESSTQGNAYVQQSPVRNPSAKDMSLVDRQYDVTKIDNQDPEDRAAGADDDRERKMERFFNGVGMCKPVGEGIAVTRRAHFSGGHRVGASRGMRMTAGEKQQMKRSYTKAERQRAAKKSWRSGKAQRLRMTKRTSGMNKRMGVNVRGMKSR